MTDIEISSGNIMDNRTKIRYRHSNIIQQTEAVAVLMRKGKPTYVIIAVKPEKLDVNVQKIKAVKTDVDGKGLLEAISKFFQGLHE